MGYGSWINVKILQNDSKAVVCLDSRGFNTGKFACVAKFEQFYSDYVDVICPGEFTFYQML